MQALILFLDNNEKFVQPKVKQILECIPGTYDFREGDLIGSSLECEYSYEQDLTIVRLANDLAIINIHGTGTASLKIALEIQRYYELPIRLTNLDYSFDFILKDFESVHELRCRISHR